MSKTHVQIEQDLGEKVVKLFESQGYNPTVMRVYIALFLSTKPLGLKEISQKTGYSVSTVCNTMDIVERTMDVRRFKRPGSKRIYYECLHDLVLVHRKKMEESYKETGAMIGILKEAEDGFRDLRDPEVAVKRRYITRLRHDYERFHEMFHRFGKMMETMRK